MATSQVKINHSEIQAYLDGGNGVEAMLDSAAEAALSRARSNSPVVTGAYRASLRVETDHTDRMVKRVTAGVDYAIAVEAQHGVLASAL